MPWTGFWRQVIHFNAQASGIIGRCTMIPDNFFAEDSRKMSHPPGPESGRGPMLTLPEICVKMLWTT